jgi:2'-5' RNA ligase
MVPEDQIHLTLRFIGEVDGSTFLDIKESLAEVKSVPITLSVKGVGHFPPRGKPRVIWAGVAPAGDVVILRNRVNSALVQCGIEPEQRKFHPHITLARLKNSPTGKIAHFLAGNSLLESPEFTLERLTLFSSNLTPKGALHRVEAEYHLSPQP